MSNGLPETINKCAKFSADLAVPDPIVLDSPFGPAILASNCATSHLVRYHPDLNAKVYMAKEPGHMYKFDNPKKPQEYSETMFTKTKPDQLWTFEVLIDNETMEAIKIPTEAPKSSPAEPAKQQDMCPFGAIQH